MIKQQLQTNEIELLVNQYRLSVQHSKGPLSFPCSNLLKVDFVNNLINQLNEIYRVSERFVIVSQFMKRYSYMIAVPYLYAMSVWDKQIVISGDRISFQYFEEDGMWLPKLHLSSYEVITPDEGKRDEWVTSALENLFKYHLSPIIGILAKQGKVSRQILWENTATYIFWIYESMIENLPNNVHVQNDFNALLNAEPAIFGPYTYNPIEKFYTGTRTKSDEFRNVRVRKTCCFYNRLPGVQVSCTTCPINCKIGQ